MHVALPALRTLSGLAVLLPVLGAAPLAAQSMTLARTPAPPIPFIEDFRHDGDVAEWRARPIDRQIGSGPGIPQVLVWVGQVAEGLVVAAELRTARDIDPDAALSIALAAADSPRLPPLGWGNQFGFTSVADSASCGSDELDAWQEDDCRVWIRTQDRHRRRLAPLFQRGWTVPLARPDAWEEVRAGPAFAGLGPIARSKLAALEPRGALAVRERAIAGTAGGRGIEILIPWAAAPPFAAPDLERVSLGVGIGDPARESRRLGRALRQHITPCRYGTAGMLISGGEERIPRFASEGAVPYMVPEPSGDLRSLIVLDNEAAGYAYEPEPDMRSPAAFRVEYPVIDVGRGERLCGPVAALARDGERVTPPGWTETGEGNPAGMLIDPKTIDVRRLANGDLLVKSGPRVVYSYYGSGQCGACPRVLLEFLHVGMATGEVDRALSLLDVVDDDDLEIEVSDDWRRVSIWRAVTDYETSPPTRTWNVEWQCRVEPPPAGEGPRWAPCGSEEDVPEPPRRLRRFFGGAYGPAVDPPPDSLAGAGRGASASVEPGPYQPQPGR